MQILKSLQDTLAYLETIYCSKEQLDWYAREIEMRRIMLEEKHDDEVRESKRRNKFINIK